MFQQLLMANTDIFGPPKEHKSYIYDCGINFYSTKQLMSQGEVSHFTNIDKVG
jgi:hypothetical protein